MLAVVVEAVVLIVTANGDLRVQVRMTFKRIFNPSELSQFLKFDMISFTSHNLLLPLMFRLCGERRYQVSLAWKRIYTKLSLRIYQGPFPHRVNPWRIALDVYYLGVRI